MGTLPAEWEQYLAARGVTPEVAQARGYRQVHSGKPLDGDYASAYGFKPSEGGLLMPLHPLLGGEAYQLRFKPGAEPLGANGKPRKFTTPKGQRNKMATSPLTRERLGAARETIVLSEGITRIDALVPFGIPAVAFTGSTSWIGTNALGGKTLLADFREIAIEGNAFILAFDGDVVTNPRVNSAARNLAAVLYAAGASKVWTLTLPGGVGLDDWIATSQFKDKDELAAAMLKHSAEHLGKAPRDVRVATPAGRLFAIDDASNWALSPQGDAHRLLLYRPKDVCVVRPTGPSDAWSLMVADKGGRWSRRAVDKLLLDAALDWQGHVTKQAAERAMSAESAMAATKHAVHSATPRGRADTLASIGAVYGLLEQRGILPAGLTVCEQNQVDGDRFSLGTPEGVLSLDTGQLLPADEARQRFVTRSIPDSYTAAAKHPYADELVQHVPAAERDYLVNALGWALRGNPGRVWYLLVGEKNGGKTTLFNAVHAAFGDVLTQDGYVVDINTEAIMASRWANPSGHQSGLVGIHAARLAFGEEPPVGKPFNEELIKKWTGGSGIQARDVGEKGPVRPAMASLFVAMNPRNLDALSLVDGALADRTKLLRYPKLEIPPGGLDKERVTAAGEIPQVRQAVVALLVRACVAQTEAPKDTRGIVEFWQERVDESIGVVGVWLREHLRVTGEQHDVVVLDELWDMLKQEFGENNGQVEGLDRNETTLLARQVVEGLPRRKVRHKRSEWRGVRIVGVGVVPEESPPTGGWPPFTCLNCGKTSSSKPSSRGWCFLCEADGPPAGTGDAGATQEPLTVGAADPSTLERDARIDVLDAERTETRRA